MAQISLQEIEGYRHSPIHHAIACHDYSSLKRILSKLPRLPKAGEVVTEEESILAEEAADKVSDVVDRRDVPNRETPLHLAVRLGDAAAVEMLMAAGADWSLQNEQGWSALQEAVCAREEGIAMIITRYYQPLAWAKWCRRLPRITGAMQRMRDFYMEITFNFESSVIPFITRIAPSDTYRIWKRGSNLRADMTLAGFDGFKIQRSNQSFLFLGDGSEDGKVPHGSLLMLTHKDKEVTNTLEGAGSQPSDAEIAQEVAIMSQTNMYRPGLDVTQAELIPQLTWRRQEKVDMVGPWKAKVYDMHHVQISVRSRRVPGAMTDEELFAAESEAQADQEDEYTGILTEEEKRQLESALSMDPLETFNGERSSRIDGNFSGLDYEENHCNYENDSKITGHGVCTPQKNGSEQKITLQEKKKGWFGWSKRVSKEEGDCRPASSSRWSGNGDNEALPGRTASSRFLKLSTKQAAESSSSMHEDKENDTPLSEEPENVKDRAAKRVTKDKHNQISTSSGNLSEYKKGLRPVLWLTQDFPLKTEELLPLLDILADKVKAVRRLRELLTTKLPCGMFPVKVAIPIIPTIRVVVTFNKIEELSMSEEFATPLSSPAHFSDSKGKDHETSESSGSWLSWIRGSKEPTRRTFSLREDCVEDVDPFVIPGDYTWIDMKEKKRRLKAKKAKARKAAAKKPSSKLVTVAAGKGPESQS
ncbi:hypothetical protein GOP47_0026893 [Adiantum capillus-veneris]|nr:hypothetical protein GOP47_0026893 [Adiantum capillus-veneris]